MAIISSLECRREASTEATARTHGESARSGEPPRCRAGVAITLTVLLAACAVPPNGPAPASSVSWEIVGLREVTSPDGRQTRWDYTIVFKELRGRTIQFERIERTAGGGQARPGVSEQPYRGTLRPKAEHRVIVSDTYQVADSGRGFGMTTAVRAQGYWVWRRFHGTDDAGHPVVVDVRVTLR